jgi:serine/threonine-protein kinase
MADRIYPGFLSGFVGPGTILNGIYEIDAVIGVGGMGEVYRGHAIQSGDAVAIKMMRPEFARNQAALALFKKEASALHQIQHDAIVRYYVFAVEAVLQRPYLAMEFVNGQSLSDLLSSGQLGFEAAAALMRRIAAGLQAAHEREVVHRDVSPQNIIVPDANVTRAKLIDFGIARSPLGDGTVIGGGFAGKFNYVSPEQLGLFGGDVTPKSDIYSLGLVLAEALTGRALDMGGTQVDVIEKRRRVPDLGNVDARFRSLLEQMLQPDPVDRPASMADVSTWPLGSPNAAAAGEPISRVSRTIVRAKASAGRPRVRPWRLAVAAAVLVGASAAGIYLLKSPRPPLGHAERIRRYVEQFDGGDCFFAAPVEIADATAVIEGLGESAAPFQALDAAFKRTNGFEASIGVRQVTHAQCPAVAFINNVRNERAQPPRLELETSKLHGGELLKGLLDGYGERSLALLLVADDGIVQNLTRELKPGIGAKSFSIDMPRSEQGAAAQPQLLIAVASAQPLDTLRPDRPIAAAELFPLALGEKRRSGIDVAVTAKYFKLEK